MAKAKNNPKKDLRIQIVQTMAVSLEKLKEGMSEKKFLRNINKASKIMLADFNMAKIKNESGSEATGESAQ